MSPKERNTAREGAIASSEHADKAADRRVKASREGAASKANIANTKREGAISKAKRKDKAADKRDK